MRIIKCDRCGAEIPGDQDTVGFVGVELKDIRTGDLLGDNPFDSWDLCDQCFVDIQTYIRMKPRKQKFEELLDSVDAGRKPAAKKETKKPITKKWDRGKAQALRTAGWKLSDIAKEVGVTESAISKNTKPAPPKVERPLEWAEHEPDLDPVLRSTSETKPFRLPEDTGG